MANIVRIGSKSPKILVSKMVWLGVRNGAKMVKIGGNGVRIAKFSRLFLAQNW